MDLKLINDEGKPAATVAGSDALFARDYNEALVHQLVTAFQANARSGTRKQKGRADVNKSHKKPWAQKGTGRARAGRRTARCGAAAARSSRARPTRISRTRSTARCTAPAWPRSCRSSSAKTGWP